MDGHSNQADDESAKAAGIRKFNFLFAPFLFLSHSIAIALKATAFMIIKSLFLLHENPHWILF